MIELEHYVTCDVCGFSFNAIRGHGMTEFAKAREIAKAKGWARVKSAMYGGLIDVCPECSAKYGKVQP